jgi:7,8-dihydropterin-6-yl-methyl-4-(beta-D-ribofuranosyl)aminobenzene 5'-phosphate synthase
MKIHVLANDKAKEGFREEEGFSLFIEYKGKNILFDTGPGEVVPENAEAMEIDLTKADYLVLSHGHHDHSNGIEELFEKGVKPKVICHEKAFVKRYEKRGDIYIGMPVTKFEVEDETELATAKEPLEFTEGAFFLGEIPRKNEFEGRRNIGYYFENDRKKDDFVADDSAIALKTEKGLVILTGCSHSGIKNICEHAKVVCGQEKIHAVIGGLHLADAYPNIIAKTALYLKEEEIENLLLMHCTGEETLKEFDKEELAYREVLAGEVIEL